MILKLYVTLVISSLFILSEAFTVGLILKKGDESYGQIVEYVLKSEIASNSSRLVKEVVDAEDTLTYHRAFCSLLVAGMDVLISPAASPYYPLLTAYAHEYHIPLITPELPEEISQFSMNFSFGIKPATYRPMLKLFRHYGWRNIIYFYDHDDGPENLNHIFTVGRQALNLTLDGILRVKNADEANRFLRQLDKSFKNKQFHVVLDTNPGMARDILSIHMNDIYVRKKNFHFVLSNPTSKQFWITPRISFGAMNVTTFLIRNRVPDAEAEILHSLGDSEGNLDILSYYYYDAALVLQEAARPLMRRDFRMHHGDMLRHQESSMNCLDINPTPRPKGYELSKEIAKINVEGVTGTIQFENGKRNSYSLNITEVTPMGFHRVASWSKGNLETLSQKNGITALPLIQTNGRLKIVTKINAPYMMLKASGESFLQGNDRFEGYCKDIIELLSKEMEFEYDLHLVEDDTYGQYEKSRARWTGIIGELIQGKADIAVADLRITGQRLRVVEFTDPFETVGFSLVMKNPMLVSKLSNMFFFLTAFTVDVWICILFSVLLFCIFFHFITKFTGAPDSIESASGIWGRKHTAIVNLWFSVGSLMIHGTGVYPRSISSRILGGFCWFFTLILSAMFIASITTQILTGTLTEENNPRLIQIKTLSLESIIAESVSRGWPKIGIVAPSLTSDFMKVSTLPVYAEFARYLENNPDVIVADEKEGINRVRSSSGNYIVLVESLTAQYAVQREPCDVIATADSVHYAGYGLATPLGSHLMPDLNNALHTLQRRGVLGDLYRKWWTDSNECKNREYRDYKRERTVHVVSGLLCFLTAGFFIVIAVFAIQYIRRNQNKESRRQQLSFEDMNLGQPLPTPPPELLAEPPPVLNLPEYDKKTLL